MAYGGNVFGPDSDALRLRRLALCGRRARKAFICAAARRGGRYFAQRRRNFKPICRLDAGRGGTYLPSPVAYEGGIYALTEI
jgi:hypothetical protein